MMLLMDLKDAPEAGESNDAKDDAQVFIRDKERCNKGSNASQQKGWPALSPQIVFSLNDYRMEHTDA